MVMGRFSWIVLLMLLCAVSSVGCSVKEDRNGCPCRLYLDFSDVDSLSVDSLAVSAVSDGGFLYSGVFYSDKFDEDCLLLLPRTSRMRLSVVSGAGAYSSPDGRVLIPYGEECPPVHMYTEIIDTDCELLERKVILKKNYCKLDIRVVDKPSFTFGLVVRGNVDGYLPGGELSFGDFCYSVPFIEDIYEVFLPRQCDNSLTLDIDDGTDVLKTFALGEYLNESGYDWNAPILEDVVVEIDFARTNLKISVEGWNKVFEFDFVI